MRIISTFLFVLSVFSSAIASAQTPEGNNKFTPPAHRVTFDYHSAFLMNLHHFMLDVSIRKRSLDELPWDRAPNATELNDLKAAVSFYQSNYAQRDVMFDNTMQSIKHGLSVDDQRRDATGLAIPAPLIAILNRVAPVYARCIWESQDKSNQAWISQARQLDTKYGAEIQAGIEKYLAHAFPVTPIRNDVVVLTGTRQGAYTDEQIIMPSGRADYQGLAALEMLYHEASHTTVTDTIVAAIDSRMKATHHKGESDLWHVLQFFTVGKLTEDVLKERGNLDYQPYALKNGLYQRAWPEYIAVIDNTWIPYMENQMNFQQAIERAVEQIPTEAK